jgi:hypothetical protein
MVKDAPDKRLDRDARWVAERARIPGLGEAKRLDRHNSSAVGSLSEVQGKIGSKW